MVVHGGRKDTGLDAVWWAKECERLGAGEILLTSMDADGAKEGFDLELLRAVCGAVSIPNTVVEAMERQSISLRYLKRQGRMQRWQLLCFIIKN